jgi:hypothetical protein
MSKKIKAIITILAGLFLVIIFFSCKKDSVFQYPPKPNVIINANDSRLGSNLIHFVKDSVYILATNIIIDSGKKLLIDAGTLIKINPSIYISINSGASIDANGTKDAPVIFTSTANKGKQGRYNYDGTWDGLRINGNGNRKSSGSLTYVRIEFAGAFQTSFLLNNVSNTTTINNIEVSFSFNSSSFEFSGGNCNASNLLSYASSGSDFTINKSYTGNLQNLLAYRHPFFAGGQGTNVGGVEIKDEGTRPVISNITIMGPSQKYANTSNYTLGNPQQRAAIITANNSKFFIRNAAIIDYPFRAYYIDSYNTSRSLEIGEADISYSLFYHADTATAFYLPVAAYLPYTSADLKIFLLRERYHNELFESKGQYMLTDPYNYYDGVPNPAPLAGSPLLTGANFTDSAGVFNDPFFKKVSYRGAMGADNWLTGWVNFVPLQTDYNN